MRSRRTPAVGLLALFAALGSFAPAANGDETLLERALFRIRTRLQVTAFLLGRLEPNTDRFIAYGGRDTDNNRRDSVLMIEFSEPVSLAHEIRGNWNSPLTHIHQGTIRIGTAAAPDLFVPASGAFYAYVEKEFDPQQGFVPKRIHRHRVLFDPMRRFDDPWFRDYDDYDGFDANTLYSVTVLGADIGVRRTVRTPDGARVGRTFSTTFRTGDEYFEDYTQPRVVGIEADDALGVPLDGRTGVEPGAAIVARFSEAMRPETFVAGASFRVFDLTGGLEIPGVIAVSADRRAFTFHPDPNLGAGPREIEVTLTQDPLDLAGNFSTGATVRFTTRQGGP